MAPRRIEWWVVAWCLVPGAWWVWTLNFEYRFTYSSRPSSQFPVPTQSPRPRCIPKTASSYFLFQEHVTWHIHFSENRCRPFMDQRINWFGGVSTPCLAKLFWFEAQVTADPLNHGPSPSDKLLFVLSPYPCCGRGPRMHGIRVEGRAYIAM